MPLDILDRIDVLHGRGAQRANCGIIYSMNRYFVLLALFSRFGQCDQQTQQQRTITIAINSNRNSAKYNNSYVCRCRCICID